VKKIGKKVPKQREVKIGMEFFLPKKDFATEILRDTIKQFALLRLFLKTRKFDMKLICSFLIGMSTSFSVYNLIIK